MAKKNYTNAGARRAVKAICAKLLKLHQDGHISSKQYISLDDSMKRLYGRMK